MKARNYSEAPGQIEKKHIRKAGKEMVKVTC